jgi:hypothetical protein
MRSLISILAGAGLASAWTELHHAPFMNKNIDSIVVPGTYTSHMHTFFGSDAITNVLPTSASPGAQILSKNNSIPLAAAQKQPTPRHEPREFRGAREDGLWDPAVENLSLGWGEDSPGLERRELLLDDAQHALVVDKEDRAQVVDAARAELVESLAGEGARMTWWIGSRCSACSLMTVYIVEAWGFPSLTTQ